MGSYIRNEVPNPIAYQLTNPSDLAMYITIVDNVSAHHAHLKICHEKTLASV